MALQVTLDDEVAALVEKEARRTGVRPEEVVRESVRKVLEMPPPFKVRARDMKLRPGLSLDNIEALLDEIEGPMRR